MHLLLEEFSNYLCVFCGKVKCCLDNKNVLTAYPSHFRERKREEEKRKMRNYSILSNSGQRGVKATFETILLILVVKKRMTEKKRLHQQEEGHPFPFPNILKSTPSY